MKRGLKITVILLTFIVLFVMGAFILLLKSKPGSNEILAYMERAYGREFQIVEEFTYITYADGEFNTWLEKKMWELKCPAVILQDKENDSISFFAYAYPLEGGDWIYRDNYSRQLLLYCIKQENFMISNEDKCNVVTSSVAPSLILENSDETAQKLQNMVICFNELYRCDDKYAANNSGSFGVEGSLLIYQILAGNTSDRWPDETSPFCYDTTMEKYKAFLNKLEEGK